MRTVSIQSMFIRRGFILPLLAVMLISGIVTPLPEVNAANETVQVWVTTADQSKLLQQQSNVSFGTVSGSYPTTITVDENTTYQTMDGFGAAMTGSSAYLFNQKMNATQRNTLFNDLFTGSGIRLNFVRQTIGASDFSLNSYTYDDRPSGQTDPNLSNFSLSQDLNDVVPMLKAAVAKNSGLKILGSPWSAPAWMKSNQSLNGGTLQSQYYGAFANYFVKYIQAYQAQGIPIYAVTVQNEPLNENGSYPTMRMEASDQANFFKNNLGPAFASNGIAAKIIAYDHNWDRPDYPTTVLNDAQARQYVAGTGFHCYAGDVSAQSSIHNAYPNKGIWFTECSGGAWSSNFGDNLKWDMSNLVIGSIRNWSKGVLLWNLGLDSNHGPTNGGCSDCRGVVTVANGGNYQKEVEYYVLGHASKFVDSGAVRIASNTYSGGIENVAFKNPDGSKVLLALNNGSSGSTFKVNWGSQAFTYTLPAGAVATFKWSGTQGGGGNPTTIDAYAQIEAESYTGMAGIQLEATSDAGGGQNVGWIEDGDYLYFDQVDFGSGAAGIQARVASAENGGSIEVRLGSPNGTLAGTVSVPGTGGWQNWTTVTSGISGASGVQKLYLVFTGRFNINWFKFSQSQAQTAAPTFSPAGGTFTSAQNVTLSSSTSGATIRYTTNGSTPTSSSTLYTGAINVSSTTTIKAIATKSGLSDSTVASATFTISSSSGVTVGKTYNIVSKSSGKALDVKDLSTANGADIQQWTTGTGTNQQFKVEDAGGGYYKITSISSGKVLDVRDVSTAEGAAIQQWEYTGGTNQQWQIVSAGNGYYKIVSRFSGKVVMIQGASTENGASIVQGTDIGANHQLWAFQQIN